MKLNTFSILVSASVVFLGGVQQLHSQGSLTPPGAPAPMMKTLAQIEPRTPISSAPFTITQPGSYYLTTNLNLNNITGITIATNSVSVDLNGFTISGRPGGVATAILLNGDLRNVAIQNGFIIGSVTNSSTNFNGMGLIYGIYYQNGNPANVRVANVSISGCGSYGIYLRKESGSIVESCTVRNVGIHGIIASVVRNCTVTEIGNHAIYADQVSDCVGSSLIDGSGISAQSVQNSRGMSHGSYGIFATSAMNSSGYSTNGVVGLKAKAAVGCYGFNANGSIGLSATTATQCIGERAGGTGLDAFIANGCYSTAGTNKVTYKYNMP